MDGGSRVGTKDIASNVAHRFISMVKGVGAEVESNSIDIHAR